MRASKRQSRRQTPMRTVKVRYQSHLQLRPLELQLVHAASEDEEESGIKRVAFHMQQRAMLRPKTQSWNPDASGFRICRSSAAHHDAFVNARKSEASRSSQDDGEV